MERPAENNREYRKRKNYEESEGGVSACSQERQYNGHCI
jgi:hypothetical protein